MALGSIVGAVALFLLRYEERGTAAS
jgi:hypothetical protein